jgi:hypothetical protein
MRSIETLGVGLTLLAIGLSMALYEWYRVKAGRPIMNGRRLVEVYWMIYLLVFVFGTTVTISAIVR